MIFFTRKKRNNTERLDIYVRITVNKERAEFSIKRDIAVFNWDIFRCRAKETDQNLILLNTYLGDVHAEVAITDSGGVQKEAPSQVYLFSSCEIPQNDLRLPM